jgi:TolB-like protein/tetratricopeptide (TPR) repeat protein
MLRLRLKVLGGFEARIDPGEPLDIAARKTRALLAYLALPPGRAHARDKLTGLLWSDRGDEQARNSLRQALTELGRILTGIEPSPLVKGRDTLSLDPEAVEVDAVLFERLAVSPDAGDLRRAAAMYAGDLLDGFGVRDPAFEEWLRDERQRYRELAITALRKLVAGETGANALAVAQRLLVLAPLQEESHRTVMRLQAEAGDIGAALHQYESCRHWLKRELDVVPSPETEALHRHIRDRTNAAPVRSEFGPPTLEAAGTAGVRAESSKLSIAVLPFRNLSDETAQRYFSDGITEDIITELSRFRSLTVIARHSSFAFRDQPLDAGEIAQKLGVECIVEGSVRRAGNRIRITARLVDAESGSQLWSEHYDRDLTDIFAVQDEIVDAIVAPLPGRIDEAGMRLARRKRPENLTAYDCFLRGLELDLTMDRAVEPSAHHWFDKAIEADPNLGLAYTCKGGLHLRNWYLELSAHDLDQALVLARRGANLDPNDGKCQGGLGVILLYRKEFDEAAFRLERALALNPNDTFVMVWMAWLATYRGRPADGLDWMSKALRLNPYPPIWFEASQPMVLYSLHRYEEAATILGRESNPDAWSLAYLLAAYGHAGRLDEARARDAKFREQRPDRSLLQVAAIEPYENPGDLDHLLEGLRKAGVST